MMSQSRVYRELGNKFYAEAGETGLSPTLVIPRLQNALNAYFNADQSATSPDEKASAQKNYAKASWRLASMQEKKGEHIITVHTSLKNGFSSYMNALKYGTDKPEKWHQDMTTSVEIWFDFACQYYIDQTRGMERARLFEELGNIFSDSKYKGQCYLSMAQALYFKGVEAMQDGNFRTSLPLTKDCYFPLEEASRLLRDKSSCNEINILREDIYLLACLSESAQARVTGDDLLQKLLNDEEDLNMTLVYAVIDWYTNAILLTRNKECLNTTQYLADEEFTLAAIIRQIKLEGAKEYRPDVGALYQADKDRYGTDEGPTYVFLQLEYEAIALGRIGRVYAKVLKMKHRAKDYYKKCIELALTLFPRSPEGEEWFKEARAFVQAWQKEEQDRENSKWENIRKQHIDCLKEEIKKLDKLAGASTVNDEELVRHIYKTHPPKNKKHVILDAKSPWDRSTKKKAIMKALTHYHPDKIDLEELGAKWKVLCEEITKVLNRQYTMYKDVD